MPGGDEGQELRRRQKGLRSCSFASYTFRVAAAKQTAFRLNDVELALMDLLCERLGISTRTDIVRLAVRRLAEAEGLSITAVTAKVRRRSSAT